MVILAAVDDESGTEVVRRGDELAQAFGEELVVLHVMPETESVAAAREVADEAIRLVLDDPEAATAVGELGDPAPRILHVADERDAEYIVLAPRDQTPIGKALMGSVSQLVLLNADCTVAFVTGT